MHVTFYRYFDRLLGSWIINEFFEESVQLLQPFTEYIVTSANFLKKLKNWTSEQHSANCICQTCLFSDEFRLAKADFFADYIYNR